MKTIYTTIIICMVGFMLSACSGDGEILSTTNIDVHAPPPEGMGRIIMFRGDNLKGSGIQPIIRVDGDHYPRCKRNSVYFIELPKGQYEISAKTENTNTVTADLTNKDSVYISCSIGFGFLVGRIELKIEHDETSIEEIKRLKFGGTFLEPVKH